MARKGRVLIGIVTCKFKEYCEDEFLKQLGSIPYPDYDVVIVDNSYDDRTSELAGKVKPHCNGHSIDALSDVWCADVKARIMTSYNKIRDCFLRGDYEFLLIIESDIFIKDWDFLRRWAKYDLPVVAGVYPLYTILSKLSEEQKKEVPRDTDGRPFVWSNSFRRGHFAQGRFWGRFWTDKEMHHGLVKLGMDTSGVSMGLILFHRDVMRHIAFKYGSTTPDGFLKTDFDFHRIDSYADTDLEIEHRPSSWNTFKYEDEELAKRLRYGKTTFQRIWENEHENEETALRDALESGEEP